MDVGDHEWRLPYADVTERDIDQLSIYDNSYGNTGWEIMRRGMALRFVRGITLINLFIAKYAFYPQVPPPPPLPLVILAGELII